MENRRLAAASAAVAGAAFVILASGGPALAAKGPARDTQVATTIDYSDAVTGAVYHVSGDLVGAPAAYTSTSDGLVSSILQGTSGDWALDTYALGRSKGQAIVAASGRTASFDFSAPTEDNTTPLPFTTTVVNAPIHLIAKCDVAALSTTFLAMAAGQEVDCPGAFRFEVGNDASGKAYRLAFQPENYAEVTRMHVKCEAVDSKGCSSWTITPGTDGAGNTYTFPDGTARSRNKLLLIDRITEAVLQDLGDYYMSFAIHVSR